MAKRLKVDSADITGKPFNFTRLTPPVKSQSDIKEYSVIKLSNGLTALLISDKSQILNLASANQISESESSASSDSESSSDNDVISEEDYDEPSTLKSSTEKLAACALCIGVGSFSDPDNIPGLAHFLEHMIFMGSEKFPKENEFDVFIKKKGGSDNASTECENTTFYFDCHEADLFRAMDIFSNLFISPLMKRESITKEREAVESEFQMSLSSDSSRKSQLLCSFADKSNPAHKFLWGNLITLKDNVSDDKLYESLHEFRKRHYSAHRMTLAVQARLPLETLENWVVGCFENVPTNSLPPDKFELTIPPFKEEEFCRLYTIDPVKDINHLDLTWVMPCTLNLYKSKPLNYLSWVIGHEGKGSLLSYLRQKFWSFGITVSSGGDGTEENSIYTLFSISLSLSKTGILHVEEILSSVFEYIKMFQVSGPQERLFKEMQLIAGTTFKFSEEVSSSENVEQLSENMHFYPSSDFITGMELYFEYDPQLIEKFLNNLKTDNVNIMISSKEISSLENLDKVEQWFGTRYHSKEIPHEWRKNWDNLEVSHEKFHLPDQNPFITSNFVILPIPKGQEVFPKNIVKDEAFELWYKQDVTFKLPHAFCCAYLISPLPQQSAQNAAMLDLFINILSQSLVEQLYPANVAQLEYSFHSGEKGIVVVINGFNEKLSLLLQAILKGIKGFNDELEQNMFLALKEEQKRGYFNASLKVGFLARDVRMSILMEKHWTALEKESALENVTFEIFKKFISQYFKQLYIQCLIQGNISKEEALEFGNQFKNGFLYSSNLLKTPPKIRINKLPVGEQYCVVQSFNVNDNNSVVTNYYQSGLGTIQESCVIELLIMMMEEPVFDCLRTKQQLGYDVSCSLRDTFGILGFSVSVYCQSDKNSVDYVEDRITEFLKDFLKTLKAYSKDDFAEIQESLLKLKKCADIHLKEEVKRNWSEIKSGEYVFDRHFKEIEYIEKITLEEVIEWFEKVAGINEQSRLKKLSTQVVGNNRNKNSTVPNANSFKEFSLILHPQISQKCITNIKGFKETLSLYPSHKIV